MLAVHGVWARRGALCLWAEPPTKLPLTGPDTDAVREALAPVLPRLAHALVARARGTVELQLPQPQSVGRQSAGDLQVERLPAVVLAPDRAVPVLLELADHEAGPPRGAGLPWPLEVGEDLRWLAGVAAAAATRARAGLLVPGLEQAEGEWWGRWYPLADRAWRRWCTTAAAVAPPAARAEDVGRAGRPAEELVGAVVADVTALVGSQLAAAQRATAVPQPVDVPVDGPDAAGAWLTALRTREPVGPEAPARALVELAARAESWRASASTQPAELLLRVAEPSEEDGPWLLQVRLRSLDDPSTVATPGEVRRGVGGEWGQDWDGDLDPWAFALAELGRAAAVHPPLLELGASPDADAELSAQQVVDLVTDGVPALVGAGFAVALPGRWLRPQLGLSVRARRPGEGPAPQGTSDVPSAVGAPGSLAKADLVAVDWTVVLGDVELDEKELAALAEQRAPLVQLRGQWVQVDADAIAKSLRFLRRSVHQAAADAPLTPLTQLLGQLASGTLPAPLVSLEGEGPLRSLFAAEHRTLEPLPPPTGLRAQLRPYQERGVAWMAFLDAHGLGGVLADDMGLGKTVQLLALLLSERERDAAVGEGHPAPTLLVCPMSVVGNWEREAVRFAPDLRVHTHHGPDRLRGEELRSLMSGQRGGGAPDLVLTTYPLVARDTDDLAAVAWRRVALDEAQHVKNLGTRAARAVRQVAAAPHPPRGTQKIALTGTPVENRLAELHAVVDFTNPGVLGSAPRFRERFSVPIERHGDENATQLLTTLTRPLVLRRTKTDPGVAPDLPAKLELVVRANLTTEQAALYKAVVDEMLAKIKEAEKNKNKEQRRGLVLATLTRLKQVCNHPAQLLADGSPFLRRGQHRSGKLALVDDILDSVVADGEKALLFTQYRELGALLVPHLEQRYGVEVPYLHGGVSKKARDAMVQRFSGRPEDQDDDDGSASPLMVLSLRAGGTGLNLVAANHVVHVDRWWNPAVEAQATDRAFRIGQTKQVQVRKLVCVGTVEERVDELMTRKADLASTVVRSTEVDGTGTGEGWLTHLSTAELHDLVRLGAEAVGE
ncbi:Superfamily II DNA or RNA helicase, SNF2 family [Quadrisphaera granulorum]|uniref:SNF2 family DNA or RNA helicase n=1 Tax=Quadrisphaera granulorum TaxID=317664 RepID=A0A316A7J8_9ACTN|nr:DEAD/DEAH box helicase [Quadrisphaera granulorum]PWJ52950.1 SNF2 family DNA or RNA helicase [Quadrisphaera granulorum]SZE97332.1 Superfamily II DNA or RNA helicase, SNF2 family [Quadrisphaera granulorum]